MGKLELFQSATAFPQDLRRSPLPLVQHAMNDFALENTTLRKVAWRIVPFLCLCYFLNILDRVNVGIARLTMQDDLGLSEAMFNLGYGIFYVGYILFEVPSNLLLRRYGARRWIARIMISWGLITAATMFARDQWTFYVLRILLGIAEAGFFPGIILYLSYWFPQQARGRMNAFFMVAIALASVIGIPLSGLIMQYLDAVAGLHDWQWLFLLSGVSTVLVGFVVLYYLTDYPKDATWLSVDQRDWLVARMKREDDSRRNHHDADHFTAADDAMAGRAVDRNLLHGGHRCERSAAYFPLLSEQFQRLSVAQIGLLSAIPHACGRGDDFVGHQFDRRNERRWHLAIAAVVAASG
ncbi:MAG: MFS transporter [Planctomycetaceae bacterium]